LASPPSSAAGWSAVPGPATAGTAVRAAAPDPTGAGLGGAPRDRRQAVDLAAPSSAQSTA
jgi:hypothetical protein